MGRYTTAESFAETVVGQSNALGGSPSTTSWVAADAAKAPARGVPGGTMIVR